MARGVFLCAGLAVLTAGCTHDDVPRSLRLRVTPVEQLRHHATATDPGKLQYRGGLELQSSDRDFGGLSALLVSPNGKDFLAVSDEAHWVTGTLQYENGQLVGAVGGQIAPMLDLSGEPLHSKAGDAEGMASGSASGDFEDIFVSFEGTHRVWRYPFAAKGVFAIPVALPLASGVLSAPRNRGLEGITRIGDGLMLAVTERSLDLAANYRAWLLSYPPPRPRRSKDAPAAPPNLAPAREVSVVSRRPYAMTDVRQLPGGDLLTLERAFDTTRGVRVELRRFPAAVLNGGAPQEPLDGDVIAAFDANYQIDNMEGLSVRVGDRGETLVYLLSDDNFARPLQRTLLLMYELPDQPQVRDTGE